MKTKHKGVQLAGKWSGSSFKNDFDMEYQLTIK